MKITYEDQLIGESSSYSIPNFESKYKFDVHAKLISQDPEEMLSFLNIKYYGYTLHGCFFWDEYKSRSLIKVGDYKSLKSPFKLGIINTEKKEIHNETFYLKHEKDGSLEHVRWQIQHLYFPMCTAFDKLTESYTNLYMDSKDYDYYLDFPKIRKVNYFFK